MKNISLNLFSLFITFFFLSTLCAQEVFAEDAVYDLKTYRPFAHIDLSDAPKPLPKRTVEGDKIIFRGVTKQFIKYFYDKIGYTAKAAEAGEVDIVPRLLLVSIKKGWAQGQTVALKKTLFYRTLLPLILETNNEIMEERRQLLKLKPALASGNLSTKQKIWLNSLGKRYRVIEDGEQINTKHLPELLERADMIPPSLALGQGAYESGYGTSRFAHEGNALFGQWTWGGGIKPKEQRKGKGDYGIKAFEYPLESVQGYALNINTHRTYSSFRKLRSKLRRGSKGVINMDGLALAETLTSYSERGIAYVKSLQGIMRSNKLSITDKVRLKKMHPIYLKEQG